MGTLSTIVFAVIILVVTLLLTVGWSWLSERKRNKVEKGKEAN